MIYIVIKSFIPMIVHIILVLLFEFVIFITNFLNNKKINYQINKFNVLIEIVKLLFSGSLILVLIGFLDIYPQNEFSIFNFFLGIFIMDTVQYFIHRLYHAVPFLYKHIHKRHHEIKKVFPIGALYNSYYEGTITGIIILIICYLFQFNFDQTIILISISYIWAIFDHTLLYDHQFHQIHHNELYYNYQQPYLNYWDRIFGTYKAISVNKVTL